MAEAAYDVQATEQKWQEHWRSRWHLRDRQRRSAPALLRALHVPVPVGSGPPGPRAQLHLRRPADPLPDDERLRRAVADRVRQLRAAGRERRHQGRRPPPPVHRRPHRGADVEPAAARRRRYDLRRMVKSHDPAFIRWNQWIFKRFLETGLAYRANAPVNWCPGCQTVLANEQVLADGTCERSGDLVEKRDLEQWFFKITAVRPGAARRPRRPRLARAGQDHAAQLDRPVRGRRVRPRPSRAPTPAHPRLHDPARHELRHDLRRAGARAPAGRRRSPTDERRADGRGLRRARPATPPRSSACRRRAR